ncbi:MAG: 3-hydroxyacyl-CoA dehydrogenase NAD-binding domain-containing protein [Corynebacterium sp.]|uniref:3-hydroxyacyl-CoA dehydrogenase/enoyl-CoA hydratase family protein n=1 Tax=Corynebacterium sp. TaxID=1720 RepID=UPI0026DF1CAE|nr:3-hydroxyacyl-CoA dehydrogenase/enoyl-CoA hydratase family protein [Corynebacterium sp.]MDO5670166.1 3-hydroxyacyl-CoA dehydrogenase NAD-binding domain-containing protein [Corynebacterium sp.]
MITHISRAAVIGAGSMGSGIAALLANAGIEVLLLDRPSPEGEDNSALARRGIDLQVERKGFLRPEFSARVTPGNIDDDAARLGEVDWIVEAVFEDLQVKHDTFALINAHRSPTTLVSSNTSTIPLADLVAPFDTDFQRHFAIIHFFNPPRVMRLVEVVAGPHTSATTIDALTQAVEQQLGKVALRCRDTPGFIANRVGNLWMAAGARLALDRGIVPELADAVFGRPFGVPRTGIFGLFDYIGLQLVPGIWGSLTAELPTSDAYHRFRIDDHPVFTGLLERGWTGRTAESGFYRGREEVLAEEFSYHPKRLPDDAALAAETAREVITTDSPAGRFARDTFLETLRYCLDIAPEIADTVADIDTAMELGYGWKRGPFALADSIGLELLVSLIDATPPLLHAALQAGGFYPAPGRTLTTTGEVIDTPARAGVVTAAQLHGAGTGILGNDAGVVSLLDDRVALLSLSTPMNSITADALELLQAVAEQGPELGIGSLVIGNDEHRAFSAGADLPTMAQLAASGDEQRAYMEFSEGRTTLEALAQAPFPVVAALRGVALGGGAELLLHCDAALAHAEAKVGFPERHVGLIPAWGGCVRALSRLPDPGAAFRLIMDASPIPVLEAQACGLLRDTDQIILSPDHVLAQAVELARQLQDSYTPAPDPRPQATAPEELLALWDESAGTAVDARIARALAGVLSNATSISETGEKESRAAAGLIVQPEMAARAEHMARTRRPLHN